MYFVGPRGMERCSSERRPYCLGNVAFRVAMQWSQNPFIVPHSKQNDYEHSVCEKFHVPSVRKLSSGFEDAIMSRSDEPCSITPARNSWRTTCLSGNSLMSQGAVGIELELRMLYAGLAFLDWERD